MEILEIIKSEYLSIVFGGLAGLGTAWLTQRVLNKRGVFSYFVNHNKVGMSAADEIFGNVSVTWNGNPVNHLYLSTIELKNESLNDYENVVIRTYTDDTTLLTESTQILDTPNIIEWTDHYKNQLHVTDGEGATEHQRKIHGGQREYLIPVFNRGEVVKISYLNAANSETMPHIWLAATLKGVKVKFRVPKPQIFGVPQPQASTVGIGLGLVGLVPLVLIVGNPWVVGLIAIVYGICVTIPGAYGVKIYRVLRETIGG
ncbi:hypothetical protein [Salinivibrio sp. KP-1]|uniref:hypothetical protein n=1 Tax=Salinivibrio sp. KP-1 TaxID=1406902 RepID=UPI0006148B01|nr:hypothetical protein [Salinivibrio sp. KP-1]KKA46004.1 hypothetical protein WN56_02515 [Salinivibrio sp. KP-1]